MLIRVGRDCVDVLEVDVLTALSVTTSLPTDQAVAALVAEGLARQHDQLADHAWLEVDELATRAAPQGDDAWPGAFAAMIAYAADQGWTADGGTIVRAHVQVADMATWDGGTTGYEVVAVVVTSRGRIALFRRSPQVSHDRGLWHCVTGYLPTGATPRAQALEELREEAGLDPARLTAMRSGPVLRLAGQDGLEWIVHTFSCDIESTSVTLNWEHDAHAWVDPGAVPGDGQVTWLGDVVSALRDTDQLVLRPSRTGRGLMTSRKAAHGHR